MNKSAFTAFVAFAVGAAAGFFVAKKVFEEKYAQLAQEEIDSVKEIFCRHIKAEDSDGERESGNGMTDEQYEEARSNPNGVMARSSLNLSNKSEAAKQNYHLISQPEKEDDDDEEEEAPEYPVHDNGTERDLEGVDRTEPYLISDREYSEEFDEHEKISLYYYSYDDVLCNENEEPMDDIDGTVGQDAMTELANGAACVWVRNEPLGIDYEICLVRNSYAQAVHGININENLSPRERYLRQQKRRENGDE